MQRPKSRLLVWGDRATDRNQEVAVAVQVSVADREGTLQVGADEVVAEDPGGALRQLAEQVVELGERCRAGMVAQLWVVHRISQSEGAWPVDAIPATTSESGLSANRASPTAIVNGYRYGGCCAAASGGRLTGPQSCEALSTFRGAEPVY
jgi:hypothetical protein